MSAYKMPDIRVATNVVTHRSNTAISRSPLSGAVQRKPRDGEHLAINLSLQNLKDADRRKMMSWVSKLNGSEHQAIIRDRSYEKPSGTLSSVGEMVDVAFNATNWEASTAGGGRGSISQLEDGVRFFGGQTASGVVIKPLTSVDGISTPTQGYSYVGRLNVSAATSGLAGSVDDAGIRWLDNNWGNSLSTTWQNEALVGKELTVAAACTESGNFYIRAYAKQNASAGTYGMTQDLSGLSVSRCLQVDNGYNALTYSEQFDNGAWTKNTSSVTANATTAPDGFTTADELIEDSTASAVHSVVQSYTRTSALELWTASVWIKENTSRRIRLDVDDGAGGGAVAYFDANSGTITSGPSTIGLGLYAYASIDAYDDGWYRCRISGFIPASTTARIVVHLCDGANNTITFNGDGSSGLYIWGASLQPGGQLGRYVETTTTAITGTTQSGREVWLMGLNHDEKQQMLAGDQIEINGHLHILGADLDGDQSGIGKAVLTTSLRGSPAHESAAIIYQPHGTFLLENRSNAWSNQPGGFSSSQLSFVEDISV